MDLEFLKNEVIKQYNAKHAINKKFPIYLDYQATTPIDPRVLDSMIPYLRDFFGNPHSRSHSYGWEAEEGVEKARNSVAALINASPREIIFTSGATESNNLSLKGLVKFYKDQKDHIITLATEHKCILDSCRHLEQEGVKVTYLHVRSDGLVDLEELKKAITPKTLVISIMGVNNEIGVIQPLEEIGKICREFGVFFHTDIAQAFGKIPIDVEKCNIDLASISGHKIYGPKGIGALYVRRKPRVRLEAMINGGGQERGMRSGTLSPALVVGLGKASEIAKNEMAQDYAHVTRLSKRFTEIVMNGAKDIYINGSTEFRYPGNLNMSFAYIEGESMILAIKDLAVSSGSACTSSSLEPSYVLKALGVGDELAHTSIRFGIGRFCTIEEIEYAAALVLSKIEKLRSMSPLWEMVQEGIDLSKIEWTTH